MTINSNIVADTKIHERSRVEASLITVLSGHIHGPADRHRFAPLAYDHYRDVHNHVPANADVLLQFLLKHKEGREFLVKAKAIFRQNAEAARALAAPVYSGSDDEGLDADINAVLDLAAKVVTLRPVSGMSSEVTRRLHVRAEEAYQAYSESHDNRDLRDTRAIDAVLAEIVEACKVAGVTDFPLPFEDRTPISRIFVFRYKAGVERGDFSRNFRLQFLPGERKEGRDRVYNAVRG